MPMISMPILGGWAVTLQGVRCAYPGCHFYVVLVWGCVQWQPDCRAHLNLVR
jgi:hypothetical protein